MKKKPPQPLIASSYATIWDGVDLPVPDDDDALVTRRLWLSFVARRVEKVAQSRVNVKKTRELKLSSLPPKEREKFKGSLYKEWSTWVKHGAVTLLSKEEQAAAPRERVLQMRRVDTDKNGANRGDQGFDELELIAKTRLVVPGFADPDALAGKIRTDAPTAPPEAVAMVAQVAASFGWELHQGDVEAAFLNGGVLKREIYLKAPRGGLPAVGDFAAIEEGTIMKARKSVYGLNDSPFEWNLEHVRGVKEVGFTQSQIHPTVFYFWRNAALEGMLCMHVDDDLIAASPWLKANVLPLLRKRFVYGKWKINDFVHCGREYSRGDDGCVCTSSRWATCMVLLGRLCRSIAARTWKAQ